MAYLSTQPPRGTCDWLPSEFTIRKYIFDTRRKVCQSFWYEEYLTPLVESADIYRAKSGEDVWGSELTLISDRWWRDIAIRPEMTPSVTRMVAGQYAQLQKPVRYFSIANFYRNEKPQRWRNREFWQLNVDIFGEDALYADVEILQVGLEIMLSRWAPKDSFRLDLNHRVLIDDFLLQECGIEELSLKQSVVRMLDKWEKMSSDAMKHALSELVLSETVVDKLFVGMNCRQLDEVLLSFPALANSVWLQDLQKLCLILDDLGYSGLYAFSPRLMRGFDYYDGMIFEMFDRHPDNNRAMFGWWRYNGLANLFGSTNFPAVWFAPGDEPTKLFLESWWLVPAILSMIKQNIYYIPLLVEEWYHFAQTLAHNLRLEGKNVELWLSLKKLSKALEYAHKKWYSHVVVLWEKEIEAGQYIVKDMLTWEEQVCVS